MVNARGETALITTNGRHPPRKRGTSTPRLLGSITTPLEYWVARSSPTACTHLQTLLRLVPLSESMMLRRHSEAEMEGILGRFGDRRLEKGGPACWLGWFAWVNRASAYAAWVAIVPARCGLAGSCVTGG